jgi:hypothetical protein
MPTENPDKPVLNAIAGAIDDALNGPKIDGRRLGNTAFAVIIFENDGSNATLASFVSNAERRDVHVAMKEMVARFDGQAELRGHA